MLLTSLVRKSTWKTGLDGLTGGKEVSIWVQVSPRVFFSLLNSLPKTVLSVVQSIASPCQAWLTRVKDCLSASPMEGLLQRGSPHLLLELANSSSALTIAALSIWSGTWPIWREAIHQTQKATHLVTGANIYAQSHRP